MKDKLEQFVKENRESFDIHEPDLNIWNKIEKNIKPKKKINWYGYINKAAIIIVVFFASFLAQKFILRRELHSLASKNEYKINIPELEEAQSYYSGLFKRKYKEMKPLLSKYPGVEQEVSRDLSELDSLYDGLEKDLRDNIANQEVIEAMIENYRLRISILEKIQSRSFTSNISKYSYLWR